MPPFVGRKRLASTPPPESSRITPAKKARLSDALDLISNTAPKLVKHFSLGADSDSGSSLSDVDSEDFEDVPRKVAKAQQRQDDEEEDEDDVDWEDATREDATREDAEIEPVHVPMAGGDIQLTFSKDDDGPDYAQQATASGKKGPTKKERATRIFTHTMHVQFLMYHNAIRNRWICDKKVQQILVEQLPAQIKEEARKWKIKSGLETPGPKQSKSPKSKGKDKKRRDRNDRNERDWGKPSERLEPGKPDLSSGDPLIHLMKVLSGYWKKRFAITAPGLRKRGYGTKLQLKHHITSYRNEKHDVERHGERIESLQAFQELAKGNGKNICGSRDVGAQLFTALCRGLGVDARMVASLQPSGFGWSKAEQIVTKTARKSNVDDGSEESDEEHETHAPKMQVKQIFKDKSKTSAKNTAESTKSTASMSTVKASAKKTPTGKAKGQGDRSAPIDLDLDEEEVIKDEDSDSVVDITPSMPKQQPPLYDRDLLFPVYWTEAISPIDHKVLPVSPLVVDKDHCVATIPDHLTYFEPRGAKADNAKLVMAYVIAHSDDGTAKDVTTRYLKRRTWPGKTKGMRIPIEKIPIYDQRGKIKRYEEYDWFKDIMRSYVRSEDQLAEVDIIEDTSDLVPQQPQKKNKEDEGDTLASLKTSADWVIERHLRREEALLPDAEPDRVFLSGKPNTASYREEDVYRRADVVKCQTAETWHKFGRIPLAGEVPMKHVPVRAVTLTRKREVEDHLKQTGEKLLQGLYSEAQTEYIIPPPIRDGKIPKNAYNNIDCFVPSMVPQGAVHLKMKGLKRICNKLEIEFAEAVVGFEFGNRMAVPVIQGVVVAAENKDAVTHAWELWAEEQRIKEEGKIEKQALDMWRKMLMGLRIRERVADEYGAFEVGGQEVPNARDAGKGRSIEEPIDVDGDGVAEDGGSEPEGGEEEEMGGGFLMPHEDDEDNDLVVEQHEEVKAKRKEASQYPTPASMDESAKGKARARKSLAQLDGADDEEEESSELELSSSSSSSLSSSDEENDDYKVPKRGKVLQKQVVTTKRTRHSLRGKGQTSPYF